MVSDTVDSPQLAEAKQIIAQTIARLSHAELFELANRIKGASKSALFSPFSHSAEAKP